MIKYVNILGVRGTGFISDRIAALDRTRHEGRWLPSAVNHVAWEFCCDTDDFIWQSHFDRGVHMVPSLHLTRAQIKGTVTRVIRVPVELSTGEAELLWANCKLIHGAGYDTRLILLYHIWLRWGQRRLAESVLRWQKGTRYTCNEFIGTTATGYEDATMAPLLVDELRGFDTTWTPEIIMQHFLGMPTAVYIGMAHA